MRRGFRIGAALAACAAIVLTLSPAAGGEQPDPGPALAVPDTLEAAGVRAADTPAAGPAAAADSLGPAPAVSPAPASAFAPYSIAPDASEFHALRKRLAGARHIRLLAGPHEFDLWELRLAPDSVRFHSGDDQVGDPLRALAWRDVRAIQVPGTHAGTGARTGAIVLGGGGTLLLPGLAAGFGVAGDPATIPILIGSGLALGVGGAAAGGILGSLVTRWETVYP